MRVIIRFHISFSRSILFYGVRTLISQSVSQLKMWRWDNELGIGQDWEGSERDLAKDIMEVAWKERGQTHTPWSE